MVLLSSGAAEVDKRMSTCLSPTFPLLRPASRLPAQTGDWDGTDNEAAGSSLVLIAPRKPTTVWFGFLQPGLIFHINDLLECPFKPSPLHIWWNLHHMPFWREMNRLVGMLLFNSPSPCKRFDQVPDLMGASDPILSQFYVPKMSWLQIMKAFDFFSFFEKGLHTEGGKE